MKRAFRNTFAVFKRELVSYFESPVAYVFLVVFLVLLGFLTFIWAGLYESNMADLNRFFVWHPVVYLLLVPAATMGLWAEERRTGTMELLFTMPVSTWQAIMGKFLASWAFIVAALALTAPVVFTLIVLGDPDEGVIISGYLGSALMAGAYVSVGMLTSAMTRSQVISFVVSVVICLVLVLAGTPLITGFFSRWAPVELVNAVASLSFWTHFEDIKRGVVDISDIGYFIGIIIFMLFSTHIVLESRRS